MHSGIQDLLVLKIVQDYLVSFLNVFQYIYIEFLLEDKLDVQVCKDLQGCQVIVV